MCPNSGALRSDENYLQKKKKSYLLDEKLMDLGKGSSRHEYRGLIQSSEGDSCDPR